MLFSFITSQKSSEFVFSYLWLKKRKQNNEQNVLSMAIISFDTKTILLFFVRETILKQICQGVSQISFFFFISFSIEKEKKGKEEEMYIQVTFLKLYFSVFTEKLAPALKSWLGS